MKRGKFYTIVVGIIIAIFCFHYSLNYKEAIKPPSEKWGKEVFLSQGNITEFPDIIEYKGNYVVAHQDSDSIKVMLIDKLGKKIKESQFIASDSEPRDIDIITDNKNIYINFLLTGADKNTIEILKLDDDLNLVDKTSIKNVINKTKVSENIVAVFYDGYVEIRDYLINKVSRVNIGDNIRLPVSAKYKNKYLLGYIMELDEFYYIWIEDGKVTEPKLGGNLNEISKVKFRNATMAIDEENVYVLIEYIFQGKEFGFNLLNFPVNSEKASRYGPFGVKIGTDKNKIASDYDVDIGTVATYGEELGTFLVSTSRTAEKLKNQTDIVKMKISKDKKDMSGEVLYRGDFKEPLSRSKKVSINPVNYKDSVIFIDSVEEGKAKLYITSKDSEFINENSGNRKEEAISAFIQTLEGMFFGAVYIVSMGLIWIIPGMSIVSLVALIEYRLSKRLRKIMYFVIYGIIFTIKFYFINKAFHISRANLLPNYYNSVVGFLFMFTISLLCALYGYGKYKKDLEHNVIALRIPSALIVDSIVTLMLYVSFIK
ncbi:MULTISPECIES: hypothetical protein [unclassified Clostridium]|uniref:hypothetical protein n=1 Tax=unclassified Clostridium TaxID=2614128 RepID=UPI000EE076B9|nr:MULTISPECIES: hypothetical protein [unclassified Clostridium]HCQ89706.1 hypothetical protein [Clostridium sp.]